MWEMINSARRGPTTFQPGQPGYGPAACAECDEPMPSARRAYGFKTCVSCASIAERARRR